MAVYIGDNRKDYKLTFGDILAILLSFATFVVFVYAIGA